jgi:hypothetical protein
MSVHDRPSVAEDIAVAEDFVVAEDFAVAVADAADRPIRLNGLLNPSSDARHLDRDTALGAQEPSAAVIAKRG